MIEKQTQEQINACQLAIRELAKEVQKLRGMVITNRENIMNIREEAYHREKLL